MQSIYVGDFTKFSKEEVLKIVSKKGNNLQYCSLEHQNDLDIVKAAITQDPKSIIYSSKALYSNNELMFLNISTEDKYTIIFNVLHHHIDDYDRLSSNMKNDRNIVKEAMRIFPHIYKKLPKGYQDDKEIIKIGLYSDPTLFKLIPHHYKDDKELALYLVEKNNFMFQEISYRLMGDPDIILIAVENYPEALEKITPELHRDKRFFFECIKKNIECYKYGLEKHRCDKDILKYIILKDKNFVFKYDVRNSLRYFLHDDEVAYLVFERDYKLIDQFHPKYKEDKALFLHLLQNNQFLQVNPDQLFNIFDQEILLDNDFCINIIKKNIILFKYLPFHIRTKTEFLKTSLEISYKVYEWIPNNIRCNDEIFQIFYKSYMITGNEEILNIVPPQFFNKVEVTNMIEHFPKNLIFAKSYFENNRDLIKACIKKDKELVAQFPSIRDDLDIYFILKGIPSLILEKNQDKLKDMNFIFK